MIKVLMLSKNPKFNETQHGVHSDTCEKLYCHNPGLALKRVKKHKPDCIFVSKQYDLETIRTIITYGCPLMYFYGDYRVPILDTTHFFMKRARAVMLTWKRPDIYKMYNCYLTRQGVNADIWKPLENVMEDYDVVFTGGNYGRAIRLDIIKRLREDFKILLVGPNWHEYPYFRPKSPFPDSNFYLNQGSVNIGTFSVGDFSDLMYYTSNRMYQGMASGKPHIAVKTPRLASCFEPEDHFLQYPARDYDALKKIIIELLNDKPLRVKIGKAQRAAILRDNTIWHAWQRMEKVIRENLK